MQVLLGSYLGFINGFLANERYQYSIPYNNPKETITNWRRVVSLDNSLKSAMVPLWKNNVNRGLNGRSKSCPSQHLAMFLRCRCNTFPFPNPEPN